MVTNPFMRETKDYIRRLDVIAEAIEESAYHLHIQTRKPIEECKEFVSKNIKEDGKFPIKPKQIQMTKRKSNGDRVKWNMDADKLLKGIGDTKSIFSPNMVVYDNPEKNLSFLSAFIDNKMETRNVMKKKEAIAKKEMKTDAAIYFGNQQVNAKTLNNSLSGAHSSEHNPCFLKTAHSTLTSSTRISTSYSNAHAERFLRGNRHYYSFEVAYQNIVSLCRLMDFKALENIMQKYNLQYPSTEFTFNLVRENCRTYWVDPIKIVRIEQLIYSLNPLERAAVCYTGDLWNFKNCNPDFMYHWVTKMISPPSIIVDKPEEYIKNADEDIRSLCGIICTEIVADKKIDDVKANNYDEYLLYASTIANIESIIQEYADIIKVLFVNDAMPSSIYSFPFGIRNVVVGSDTDSTMYTCQDWVEWYCGKLIVDRTSQNVSASIMYLNTQVVAHLMAMISRQIGVPDKNLYRLRMKNEYSFLIYMVANRTKHYAAMINAKEGNIYKKPELEIKGVALKDSKMPPELMNTLEKMIEQGMKTVMSGEKISLYETLQRVANIEHTIINSINNGEIRYYSKAYIKPISGYKNPMVSVYAHYDFWQNTFALKYGAVGDAPLQAIKISNTLDTANRFTQWVNTIDPYIGDQIRVWQLKNNKKYLGQFILPLDSVRNGVPKEFISAIDIRNILKELMQGFYIYLEILGVYMRNDNITRLVSDDIQFNPDSGVFL